MKESTVKINLTMNDKASDKLESFKGVLKGLDVIVNNTGKEISKLAGLFTVLKDNAKTAVGEINALQKSLQGLSSSARTASSNIEALGTKSQKAGTELKSLETNSNALVGLFSRLGFAVDKLVIDMNALRLAAHGVGGTLNNVLTQANNTTGLVSHSRHVQQLTNDYNNMSRAMVGALQMWGANKIGSGLKGSVNEAVDVELTENRSKMLGLDETSRERIKEAAKDVSNNTKGASYQDAVRSITEMYTETGDIDRAIKAAPSVIKGEQLYKFGAIANTGKEATPTDIRSIQKGADRVGMLDSDEKYSRYVSNLIAAQTVTGSANVASNSNLAFKYMGSVATGLDDDGALNVKLAASDKFAGPEIGTSIRSLATKLNMQEISGSQINEWAKLGAFTPEDVKKIVYTKDGNIDQEKTKKNGVKNQFLEQFTKDPIKFFTDFMPERLKEQGIDIDDNDELMQTYGKLMNAKSAGAATTITKNRNQFKKDSELAKQASAGGLEQQVSNIDTAKLSILDLEAKIKTLAGTVGNTVLVALKPFVEGLTSIVQKINEFGQAHPQLMQIAVTTTAFVGFGLAVGAVVTWLGGMTGAGVMLTAVFGRLAALFTGDLVAMVTRLATGFGSIVSSAAPLIATLAAVATSIAAIGLAWAYWDEIVAGLEQSWEMIKQAFSDGVDFVVNTVTGWWESIKQTFNESVDSILSTVLGWVDNIGQLFGFENASQALIEFWNSCVELWNESVEFVGDLVLQFIDYIAQLFGFTGALDALNQFSGFVSNIWSAIKTTITDLAKQAYDAVMKYFGGLIEKASSVISKIKDVAIAAGQVIGVVEQNKYVFDASGGQGPAQTSQSDKSKIAQNQINTTIIDELKTKFNRKIAEYEFAANQKKAINNFVDLDYDSKVDTPSFGSNKSSTKPSNYASNASNYKKQQEAMGSGGGGGGRSGGGGGSSREAQAAKDDLKAMERQAKDSLDTIESQLKNGLISYDEYFSKKSELITSSVNEEIAMLEKQKAAYQAAGNMQAADKIEKQLQTKRNELTQKLQQLENEKAGVSIKKKEFELEIEEKLAGVTGNRHDSEIAKLDIEMSKLREKAKLMGATPETMSKIDRIEEISRAKIEYAELEKQVKKYGETSDLAAKKAASAAKLGSITATEASNAATEAYREEGNAIAALIPELERYAQIAGDPAMLKNLEELKIKSKELANQVNEDARQMKDAMQGNFEGFLNDLSSGKGIKGALKGLADNIHQTISKVLNKQMSEKITNMLFGTQENGKFTGGFGSFFQGIISKDGFNQGGSGGMGGFDGMFSGIGNMFSGLFGGGEQQGGQGGGMQGLGQAASLATSALTSMTKDGVQASTTALGENIMKTVMGTSVETTATAALTQLASAAQAAAASLSSLGSGGGGGGGLFDMFSDIGGSIFGSFSLPSFDVGADTIPRDMIAQIHKGEMILPASTADKVRNGLSNIGGGSVQNINNFHLSGPTTLQSQQQIASMVGASMNRAIRRNG